RKPGRRVVVRAIARHHPTPGPGNGNSWYHLARGLATEPPRPLTSHAGRGRIGQRASTQGGRHCLALSARSTRHPRAGTGDPRVLANGVAAAFSGGCEPSRKGGGLDGTACLDRGRSQGEPPADSSAGQHFWGPGSLAGKRPRRPRADG